MSVQSDAVDYALATFRLGGAWQLQEIASPAFDSVDALAHALRRLPGDESGAVALVAVDEDFFVLVRVEGTRARVLLSDITAATEWELARSALDALGLPPPEDDDEDDGPAGDLDLLGDLGVPAVEMGALLDDPEAFPDEILSDVARALGFGELFDDAVGLTSA